MHRFPTEAGISVNAEARPANIHLVWLVGAAVTAATSTALGVSRPDAWRKRQPTIRTTGRGSRTPSRPELLQYERHSGNF
ncbi:hypothetical protein CRENBAI_022055 [Crenichthys baileyi]|uniref:Uncharacterized protein n=1 Tax=Crenichthys baileyi TaxID=28760 RepID=A0AAV9SL21_9TELE